MAYQYDRATVMRPRKAKQQTSNAPAATGGRHPDGHREAAPKTTARRRRK